MTTGATGQLGLALPVQGELSGTWGDTVNNGITQYTNIAIAGTLTLTGDGAVTLANTTGDASASNITSTLAGAGTVTAQFAIVKVSGTTTTKVVTGPSYSKTYVVDNASSFAVTFKASGQTGVSVAAAEKVTVVFNGTDYIKLAGTIANAAGSNTQIQFNNGGLFGASSNLTWDGTTLSSTQVNITGQGTLRLQDTTGGEYVGLRSPSALGASYTLTFPADDGTSGQALITDGSGGLSWSTAASGDVYGPASATNNALARFDGTTGKLIKDSSALTFDGAELGLTLATAPFIRTTESSTGIVSYFGSYSGGNYIGTTSNHPVLFYVNATEQMRLNSTGLGIGTSSPTSKLDVSGVISLQGTTLPTAGTARIFSRSSDSSTYIQNATGGNFYLLDGSQNSMYAARSTSHEWATNNTTKMTLDSAGNLGLGVTPSAWDTLTALQVKNASLAAFGNSTYLYSNAYYQTAIGNRYIADGFATRYTQGSGKHIWETAPSSTANATATFTEAMTLDASGNLGVGVTSPAARVDTQVSSGAGYRAYKSTTGGFNALNFYTANENVIGTIGVTSTNDTFYLGYTTTPVLTWNGSGNVGVGITSPGVKLTVAGSSLTLGQFIGSSSATYIEMDNASGSGYIGTTGNALVFLTAAAGNEQMRLTSTGLGIGTTSPAQKLDIGGGGQIYFSSGQAGNLISNNAYVNIGQLYSSGGPYIGYGAKANPSVASAYVSSTTTGIGRAAIDLGADGTGNFRVFTGSAESTAVGSPLVNMVERARIDPSGNLLVGATTSLSPSSGRTDISVNGSSNAIVSYGIGGVRQGYLYAPSTGMILASETGTLSLQTAYTDPIVFSTNGSERARVDSSGNFIVGGTTAINSLAGRGNITINGSSTAILNFGVGSAEKSYIYYSGTFFDIFNVSNNAIRFGTNATERMRIQANGGLSFANTASPGAFNTLLGDRNNHFTGQRSNTVAGSTTSTMLTITFDLNGAAIVRVVDTGTIVTSDFFANVYEYFVTCYAGTVTATLKQSQNGGGAGSYITTSTGSSTFNVIQTTNGSLTAVHDTAVDILVVSCTSNNHATTTITMAANN